MSARTWNKVENLTLIEEYKRRPVLYDFKKYSPKHHKSQKKVALREISDIVSKIRPETSVRDVKNQINTMSIIYKLEGKFHPVPDDTSATCGVGWSYKKHLSFLDEHIKEIQEYSMKKASSPLSSEPSSEDEESFASFPPVHEASIETIESGSGSESNDCVVGDFAKNVKKIVEFVTPLLRNCPTHMSRAPPSTVEYSPDIVALGRIYCHHLNEAKNLDITLFHELKNKVNTILDEYEKKMETLQ